MSFVRRCVVFHSGHGGCEVTEAEDWSGFQGVAFEGALVRIRMSEPSGLARTASCRTTLSFSTLIEMAGATASHAPSANVARPFASVVAVDDGSSIPGEMETLAFTTGWACASMTSITRASPSHPSSANAARKMKPNPLMIDHLTNPKSPSVISHPSWPLRKTGQPFTHAAHSSHRP